MHRLLQGCASQGLDVVIKGTARTFNFSWPVRMRWSAMAMSLIASGEYQRRWWGDGYTHKTSCRFFTTSPSMSRYYRRARGFSRSSATRGKKFKAGLIENGPIEG